MRKRIRSIGTLKRIPDRDVPGPGHADLRAWHDLPEIGGHSMPEQDAPPLTRPNHTQPPSTKVAADPCEADCVRVFLSSTFEDLAEHRRAVAEALERLGQRTIRMEVFGARPEEPVDACRTLVASCDLFVGIYAHRYGSVPRDAGVSMIELEYNEAARLGIPILAFMIDDEHEWKPRFIEGEPGCTRLERFKAEVSAHAVRDTFTTSIDLAYKVAASVAVHLLSAGRWDRSSLNDNPYEPALLRAVGLYSALAQALLDLVHITRTDYNQIFLLSTATYYGKLLAVADAVGAGKQRCRVASFDGVIGNAFTQGVPIVVPDVSTFPGYIQAVIETKAEAAVPIRTELGTVGVVHSEAEALDYFTAAMVQEMGYLADALGMQLRRIGWLPSVRAEALPWVRSHPPAGTPGDAAARR